MVEMILLVILESRMITKDNFLPQIPKKNKVDITKIRVIKEEEDQTEICTTEWNQTNSEPLINTTATEITLKNNKTNKTTPIKDKTPAQATIIIGMGVKPLWAAPLM